MKVIKPSVEIMDEFDGLDVMLRTPPAAHPQMREVVGLLLKELKAKIPVVCI